MTPLEVLAAHRAKDFLVSGLYETRCPCGWVGVPADHAAHVLDALTNSGHAFVELPEAERTWPLGHARWMDDAVTATPVSGRVRVYLEDCRLSAEEARELAAALLAAAAAAETGGKA